MSLAASEKEKVLAKMQRYCAYQDRCHFEVRRKLLEQKVYGDDLEEIMAALVEDDFLNEERFARSFARGKFRIKQWGRLRIKRELKVRQISDYCIRKAMTEIDDEDYLRTAKDVADMYMRKYDGRPAFEQVQKAKAAMVRRGFEFDLIGSCINSEE